jgi:hypothetical protein
MSNIVEPQIVEKKPSVFSDFIKKNPDIYDTLSVQVLAQQKPNILESILGNTSSTPVLCKDGTTQNQLSSPNARYADACVNNGGRADLTAQQKAQLQLAQQQALMEQMTTYSGLTDKVFGKGKQGSGLLDPQIVRVGAYIILGAVVGRYVAKNMKKSTTLGMVVGGLAPLLVLKLTMEYDKKNMPKQEPRQKVAIEPKPTLTTITPNAMPLDLSFQELSKTPNEFTIKSNGFNTRYYKDVSKTEGIFSFASPNLYKQPYSTTGMSGVQPTKISTREFLDAYNEFLKQPK